MWLPMVPLLLLAALLGIDYWWVRRQRTHPSERWRARRKALKDRFTPEERELHLDQMRRKYSAETKKHEKPR